MMNRRASLILGLLAPLSTAAALSQSTYEFSVYLDEKPVGRHRFVVAEEGQSREVRSEAKFDVRFLGFSAYRYFHNAEETWQRDCLAELRAQTDDNGKLMALKGSVAKDGFLLSKGSERITLPACVMTYAYWNPRMLAQRRLLNPQTGEFSEVEIKALGRDAVTVRGSSVIAQHYRLSTSKFLIDLWYADDRQWIALDSQLESGRILRYRIE
jgi:hypothetical protein